MVGNALAETRPFTFSGRCEHSARGINVLRATRSTYRETHNVAIIHFNFYHRHCMTNNPLVLACSCTVALVLVCAVSYCLVGVHLLLSVSECYLFRPEITCSRDCGQ